MINTKLKYFIQLAKESAPRSIKNLLCKLRVDKLWTLALNKSDVELFFQMAWAKEFVSNKQKVLEYWKEYRFLDEITGICKLDESKKILDVGCGISTILHYIEGEKYAIDPLANEYLKVYNYPKDIMIQHGLGEKIPFQDHFFDIVFCSNALDHTINPHETIREIYRVLKDNGFFVFTVEIFETEGIRDLAHPHTFTNGHLHSMIRKKFLPVFQKLSPWIGLRQYVQGGRKSDTKESVMVCQKLT